MSAFIAIGFGVLFLIERHFHAKTRKLLYQALDLEQQERARRQEAEAALRGQTPPTQSPPIQGFMLFPVLRFQMDILKPPEPPTHTLEDLLRDPGEP